MRIFRFSFLMVVLFSFLSVLGLATSKAAELTTGQQNEIKALIRDYLIKNPEIIQEALNELEKRQADQEKANQNKALSEWLPVIMKSGRSTVLGNPKGDVTLVEFFDYNCGYCKRALTDLQKLMDSDKNLRVIIRDFPVLGPDSVESAVVAVAVRQHLSGPKYMEFHVKLLETKGRIGKDRALAVAKEMNVDLQKLQKDMDLPETKAILSETMQIGDALRLQGTPAYLIGEEIVFGAVGYQSLKDAIDSTRRCGKAQCS